MRFTRIAGTSTRMYALSEAGNIYYLDNKDVWVPLVRAKDSEPIPPEVPSWDVDDDL